MDHKDANRFPPTIDFPNKLAHNNGVNKGAKNIRDETREGNDERFPRKHSTAGEIRNIVPAKPLDSIALTKPFKGDNQRFICRPVQCRIQAGFMNETQ